ncbi:MAG: 16S rRNA (guanine966-N2)-methyltransferase [Cryomorphaceae bacterium]|jgi:16S rRNA (guanine966-N2)-methyltransferase
MKVSFGEFYAGAYIVWIDKKITMNKRAKSNTIRIIAGTWRGRRLPVIDSDGLRPTTDRVRETLFNWLMGDIAGARCLDLFAGTGALGLECLSRGAEFVQFVESEAVAAKVINDNLGNLGVENSALSVGSAIPFLQHQANKKFNLVFLDPPFDSNLLSLALPMLVSNSWLAESALVYIERGAQGQAIEIPRQWTLHREARTGQSHYALYRV